MTRVGHYPKRKRGSQKRPDQTVKFMTVSEVSRLLNAAKHSPRDHLVLLLAYRHGLRAREVSETRVSNVDLIGKTFAPSRLKESVSVSNPMREDEIAAVKRYLATRRSNDSPFLFLSRFGTAIEKRSLDRMIKRYGKEAGISAEKLHMHALKHSCATHVYEATGDLYGVADWLGHRSIKSTTVYAQLSSARRQRISDQSAKYMA